MIRHRLTSKQYKLLCVRYAISKYETLDGFLYNKYNVKKRIDTLDIFFNTEKELTWFLLHV